MKIIIAGAYAIGTYLAKLLSRNMQDIVLMDENPENLEKISSEYDLLTMECSPTNIKGLKEASANHKGECTEYRKKNPRYRYNKISITTSKKIVSMTT